MSRVVKGYSFAGVLAGLVGMSAMFLILVPLRGAQENRQIVLVARNMVFMLEDGDGEANPTLTFKPGEQVTILLRNDDPGMRHDLVIESLDVRSKVISFGQSLRLTFTVPTDGDAMIYMCSLHPYMMRGDIRVRESR
jgi:plastocyanin